MGMGRRRALLCRKDENQVLVETPLPQNNKKNTKGEQKWTFRDVDAINADKFVLAGIIFAHTVAQGCQIINQRKDNAQCAKAQARF